MKYGLKTNKKTVLLNQKGITLPLVAILLFVILGIVALTIDLAHLYVVRNELQNAADAGALAGARFLYTEDGTAINYAGFSDSDGNTYASANQIAYDAARDNRALAETGWIAVDVNWSDGQNSGANVDVQRGHWSFATHTFTANDSLLPVDLARTTEELDGDPNFINAVRVVARRQETPAASFFARIFGYDDFELSTDAVAYIGFAGSLQPEDVEQPIAICMQSITQGADETFTCATGRMVDSGGGSTHNTAAWTNFSQPCETASVPSVRPLICSNGNQDNLSFGEGMGTVGGMQDTVYRQLRDCWLSAGLPTDDRGYPTEVWNWKLPVIDCPDNNPGPCSTLLGTVDVKVLWIKQSNADPNWEDIPLEMDDPSGPDFTCSEGTDIDQLTIEQRQTCWSEFTSHFNLKTADGTDVGTLSHSQVQSTMFFVPSCDPHYPRGRTGGINFGVLARIPVLVR